jgi:hypothetical protein
MGPRKWSTKTSELDDSEYERKSSTKGWIDHMEKQESLPVLIGGRVVRTFRDAKTPKKDVFTNDDASINIHNGAIDGEDSGDEDKEGDGHVSAKDKSAARTAELEKLSVSQVRVAIARICSAIMIDPTGAIKRKKPTNIKGVLPDETEVSIMDLFEFMKLKRRKCCEIAILSGVLVFKDICPGYRIRSGDEHTDVKMKKETKRLRDFERGVLHAYQQFLSLLSRLVKNGLGNAKGSLQKGWTDEAMLGLSALRCQCELIHALPHFNLRSTLLNTIVQRSLQPTKEIKNLCVSTMTKLFESDRDGEVSLEMLKLVAQLLIACHYNVDESYLRMLQSIQLRTSLDQAKSIRKSLKKDRRKRRRQEDDVETGLAEADSVTAERQRRKFQADCLQEVCLIYFRVIKKKVGLALLPVALEGMGKITHLVNLETVEDLLCVLKSMLDGDVLMERHATQVLCVLCALRTLAGPGKVLNFNENIFVEKTNMLLIDVPAKFALWSELLECVRLSVLGRVEPHNATVDGLVSSLLLQAVQNTGHIAATIIGLAHQILLKYPRVRNGLLIFKVMGTRNGSNIAEEDREPSDLAMTVFREQQLVEQDTIASGLDGTWALSLARRQFDAKVRSHADVLSTYNIVPLDVRVTDAMALEPTHYVDNLIRMLETLPKNANKNHKYLRNDTGIGTSDSNKLMSKKQKNKAKALRKQLTGKSK